MVDGVLIDNRLLILGDIVGGFAEIVWGFVEAEKVVLNLESDTEIFAEFAEDF